MGLTFIAFKLKRDILFRFRYFAHGEALALSQRVVGLYILALKPSSIELNRFARRALSQLTAEYDLDLYEEFLDAWGTHIITALLVGGMIEERASVKRCFVATSKDAFERCIPFSSRAQTSSNCAYYASQARVTSKRRLGGNVEAKNDNEWKRTLAGAPALLQILTMMPWYAFVSNKVVKQNLRASIQYRLRCAHRHQVDAVLQVNARLPPCFSSNTRNVIFSVFVSMIVQLDAKERLRCVIYSNRFRIRPPITDRASFKAQDNFNFRYSCHEVHRDYSHIQISHIKGLHSIYVSLVSFETSLLSQSYSLV